MVETLMTNTKNSVNNLQKIGFYLDEGGNEPTAAVATNTGWQAYAALAQNSASMEFCGDLLVDFFKQSKNIPTRTSVQIKLYPSSSDFVIFRDEHAPTVPNEAGTVNIAVPWPN